MKILWQILKHFVDYSTRKSRYNGNMACVIHATFSYSIKQTVSLIQLTYLNGELDKIARVHVYTEVFRQFVL